MFRNRIRPTIPALAALIFLAGCTGQVGPPKAKDAKKDGNVPVGPGPVGPGPRTPTVGDPAEQPAVAFIQKQGGGVKRDEAAPNKPVVEVLLNFTKLTDDGLKELAPLSKLRRLEVRQNPIKGTGLAALAGLKELEVLDLAGCEIDDAGAKELAKLKPLKVVQLSATKITDTGLKELAALENLEEIGFEGRGGAITAAGVSGLVSGAKKLKRVNAGNNLLGDEGVAPFAQLPQLEVLSIHGTRVTDKGLAPFAKVATLRELNLSGFGITDTGMKHVAACKGLERLSLFNTKLTDAGLKALAPLTNLKELDLTATSGVTSAAREQFTKDHPGCKIKK